MRLKSFVVLGLLGAANAGCGEEFLGNALRNTAEAPVRALDEHQLEKRCLRWANEVWELRCHEHPEQHDTQAFHEGFVYGYVDFLTRGGKGNPPAVPPFRYQLFNKFSEPGTSYDAALEWFAGFRAGASEARETGMRDDIVIPLASPPTNAVDRRATLEENHSASHPDATTIVPEKLPSPQKSP